MKNLIILGVLILTACNEQVTKFLFDNSKISTKTTYFYEYKSDKLIRQTEKLFIILPDQVVDSSTVNRIYDYNSKGLVLKETSQSSYDKEPSIKYFKYNRNDSLVSEITINQNNDTVLWLAYNYFPDGRKITFNRLLYRNYNTNQDLTTPIQNRKFDTIFNKYVYNYAGNQCKSRKEFNKNGKLVKIINYEYLQDRLIKEIHFKLVNDLVIEDMEKNYDYSRSNLKPTKYCLNIKNDTIEYESNDYINDDLHISTFTSEYGNMVSKTFYKAKKKIGMISIDRNRNIKYVEAYDYWDNGNMKEIKSYTEELVNSK
jgi:hypothetical protein